MHGVEASHMTLSITSRGGAVVPLARLDEGEGDSLTVLLSRTAFSHGGEG